MLFGALVGERATVEGSYQTVNLGDDSQLHVTDHDKAIIDETFK